MLSFLRDVPPVVSELHRKLQHKTGQDLTTEYFHNAYEKCLFHLTTLLEIGEKHLQKLSNFLT